MYHGGSDEGGQRARHRGKKLTASKSGENPEERPIWLGHHSKDTRKYYKPVKNKKGAHFSKVRVKGQTAHHKNPEVKKLLSKHGHKSKDITKYNKMLSLDPDHKAVHDHPITKVLKKHDYHGWTHPDHASTPREHTLSKKLSIKKKLKTRKRHDPEGKWPLRPHVRERELRHPTNTVVFHRKNTENERTIKQGPNQ